MSTEYQAEHEKRVAQLKLIFAEVGSHDSVIAIDAYLRGVYDGHYRVMNVRKLDSDFSQLQMYARDAYEALAPSQYHMQHLRVSERIAKAESATNSLKAMVDTTRDWLRSFL